MSAAHTGMKYLKGVEHLEIDVVHWFLDALASLESVMSFCPSVITVKNPTL